MIGEVRPPRDSLSITLSVWKALFLREAVTRLSNNRLAWLWLLFDPIVRILLMLFIFVVVHVRTMNGIDIAVWLMAGMLSFSMYSKTANQTQNAVGSNQALFSYRQVKPVDTALVRAVLDGFLETLVAITLLSGAALFGRDTIPHDPLLVLAAFFGLWLVGTGFGLVTSVVGELIPELGKVINIAMTPLYFASGVIIPLRAIPEPYLGWLFLNPLADGVEIARQGFSPYYQAVPEASLSYMFLFAISMVFIGLALHIRFSEKLVAR